MERGTIRYGKRDIHFTILTVARKTLEIAVHPDACVVVKAPPGTRYEDIEQRVMKRARWICRQIDYFRQFEPRTTPRRYLSGETHLYLGRRYRLKVQSGPEDSVKLQRGTLLVLSRKRNDPGHIKRLLDDWYADKARNRFQEYFEGCWANFGRAASRRPVLHVRRMKTRWGSLSKNGTLTLNVQLIRAPRECIEYVITHELCHLIHHDHGKGFFRAFERAMPDWTSRKHKLELMLV